MTTYVTYYSETGNTEKIAKGIFDGVEKEEKELVKLSDIDSSKLEGSDLVFIGFPVHAGGLPKDVKSFMKGASSIKNVAIFCTHSSPREMKMVDGAIKAAEKIFKGNNSEIVGNFDCFGSVNVDSLLKMPMIKQSEEFWKNRPNDDDLKNAKDFGREISSKI